ncbi:MAG: tyrosine/phenylalanine carboxypeptidase domain-containing protein, partial [Leeuwenhoekiella sp.]
ARSCASHLIIGDTNFSYFKTLLNDITQKMAKKFGSFLLLEIYSGSLGSTEFVVRGPAHKLPASVEELKCALSKIESRKYKEQLTARIEQTRQRHESSMSELYSVDELKKFGATLLGLEIPPVYRSDIGKVYPIYFRKFRNNFTKALQKAMFEFVRVQTTAQLPSYNALGRRNIHEQVFKIDQELAEIQSSYQFLLLVAPVNIQALRQRFFDTNFNEINDYHYRLLPVDPDLLKRKLYNLRIDEIDDPALSFLYDEKREEIDQELTMLKERGSKNFFYSSIRLYKGLAKNILAEAELLLRNNPETPPEPQDQMMDVQAFRKLAQDEFKYFREQSVGFNSKVHIRDDVNVMMVSEGELYLPSDYKMTHNEAQALIQHELGTHALTYYNGSQQPLKLMAQGMADYDPLQEGIAVLAEYLVGALNCNRLRILAGRVIAGAALLDGADFKNMFSLLHVEYGFSKEYAFNITSRMFQGGGFLKDIIYLKGLVELRDYMGSGGELLPLLAGKFALKHVNIVKDLTERGLMLPPKIKPRYFNASCFEDRMTAFKNNIALSKMI